jgi:hypothetical protein
MSVQQQSVPGKKPVALFEDTDEVVESTSHMAFKSGPGRNPLLAPLGGGAEMAQTKEKSEHQQQAEQKMQAACEQLVDVQAITGSAFSHIGYCKICGWQSMGHDEQSCKDAVKTHAQIHWPEIQGTATQSAAPKGGTEGEQAGGDKGGADSPHGGQRASKN